MIIDQSTAKKLLRISADNTEYDDYIDAVIEPLQLWLQAFLKNDFISERVYINSRYITFDSGNSKIICDDPYFGDYQFTSGIDIEIAGSFNNDGIYTVTAMSSTELTVSGTLVDENTDDHDYTYTVTIAKKVYPQGLQIAFAKLLKFNLKTFSMNPDDQDAQSESFAGYSYSEGQPFIVSSGKYPSNILLDLLAFKPRKAKLF